MDSKVKVTPGNTSIVTYHYSGVYKGIQVDGSVVYEYFNDIENGTTVNIENCELADYDRDDFEEWVVEQVDKFKRTEV